MYRGFCFTWVHVLYKSAYNTLHTLLRCFDLPFAIVFKFKMFKETANHGSYKINRALGLMRLENWLEHRRIECDARHKLYIFLFLYTNKYLLVWYFNPKLRVSWPERKINFPSNFMVVSLNAINSFCSKLE